jgi:beta-galactosidase/beta-glucuronidase
MKKAKLNELYTPYAEKMDKACPWAEYPRPQLKRDSYFNLNGEWELAVSRSEEIPEDFGERILVPFPPESSLSCIGRSIEEGERLYYRRRFTLPEGFCHGRVILHIGACDQISEIFLNGKFVSKKEGGYTPHSADVTDYLAAGENELTVKATDDLDKTYPYGKQRRDRGGMWYTPVSGIWQTVWMESLPKKPIESIKITPTAKNVRIGVASEAEKKILTLDSGEQYEFSGDEILIEPENPIPWTPENPHIYRFTLETETDRIESYFALREVGIGDFGGVKRITLNGKPYVFNGLLDQGYYPDGIFLPATAEGYAEDIRYAKECGFNMLRKHIKIEPQIFYYLCDTMGIAVFQDMINNSDYSFLRDTALPTVGVQKLCDRGLHKNKKSREVFISSMLEEADLLYNCPSIVYYTIFNEGWGQFSADEMYGVMKDADPTRIIDSTSGWFRRKRSDVDSRHIYFKPLKVKDPDGRPLVISEFGGYAHRCEGHLSSEGNYGYRSFAAREELEAAVVRLYEEEVLPLAKAGASAFVYTQVSDVEDETNGIFTYDRQVRKLNAEKMREVMNKIQ